MKTLLFLPGLLEDADGFAPLIARMKGAHAESVVADLTRHDTVAELATSALEQAPDGPLWIAGHSMGGYVALEMARQAPERIAGLALMNTHARPDSPESTENRRRLVKLAETDFPAVNAALLPKLMTPAHLKDPVLSGVVGAMALAVGKDAFARQQAAIIGRIDSRPHLKDIRCPTLVIAARDDALMPLEWLEELASGIPGARLEVVEDSGHLAPLEQPAKVAALLCRWIGAA